MWRLRRYRRLTTHAAALSPIASAIYDLHILTECRGQAGRMPTVSINMLIDTLSVCDMACWGRSLAALPPSWHKFPSHKMRQSGHAVSDNVHFKPRKNTTPWPSAGLMLAQRRRRWANISPAFGSTSRVCWESGASTCGRCGPCHGSNRAILILWWPNDGPLSATLAQH